MDRTKEFRRHLGKLNELLLVIAHSLLQALSHILGKFSGILMTYPTRLLTLSVIHVSEIVKGSSFAKLHKAVNLQVTKIFLKPTGIGEYF